MCTGSRGKIRGCLPWLFSLVFAGTCGHVLGSKFISIGSDDWGRWTNHGPVWPNEATRQAFHEQGLWLSGGDPPKISAESDVDIEELLNFIESLNVGELPSQQVVITPFWVVAGPDFEAMRDSGCPGKGCTYSELWWHNSSGGLAREPYERGDLRSRYRDGFDRGLWRPQYHGRSHFDVQAWTAYLEAEEEVTSVYFGHGLTYYHYGKKDARDGLFHSTHSEYKSDHRTHQRGPEEMKRWVEGGLGSFKAFWGYDATVSALPCHYGDDFVGGIFKTLGVEMVEGEEGGRGLLPHVRGMGRVMFDPAFETEDRWEGVLEAALARVRARLGSEGMAAVQWHAQNSLGGGPGGVFSARERLKLQDLFRRFVHALRADGEDLVWVTASEMAQLAERRWSSEGWPGWVRLRNYNEHPVAIDVSHARAQLLPRSPPSPLGTARLWRVAGACKSGSEKDAYGVAVLGSELDLDAGCEYVLALGASAADLPVAAQRLVLPSPINTRAAADRRGAEPRAVASGAERGWDVVEGEELEELQALGDQQREAAVQGVAEWAPNGVAAQAAVRWDVQAAAGSEGVMVSVWVDGFEFLSAESGVRAEIGYAALLLGHVRVATLFEPHRAIQVDHRMGLPRDNRRGMRLGRGLAEVLERGDAVLASVVLYHGDGTPMGVVSSLVLDLAQRRPARQQHTPSVALFTAETKRASELGAAQQAAVAAELRCLEQGAHCRSLCGWEGVVPIPCPRSPPSPPPSQPSASDVVAVLSSWDSDALAVSVVVLVGDDDPDGAALGRTLRGLREASAYPLHRIVVVARAPSPAASQRVLADFTTWAAHLDLVLCPPRSSDLEALALAYARVDTPWALVTTDRVDFTGRGPWLAEAIAVLRADPKAAALPFLRAADRSDCPLLRAAKTASNHSFFPFASSWESPAAGLTLLPALHRRDAFARAQPLAAFPALADLEAFLRLLGYSALSLVADYARLRSESEAEST